MTTSHLNPTSSVPPGARCSHCGTAALVRCRCCERTMCLAHAVFFVTVGCSPKALSLDAVECPSCDEQDEPQATT